MKSRVPVGDTVELAVAKSEGGRQRRVQKASHRTLGRQSISVPTSSNNQSAELTRPAAQVIKSHIHMFEIWVLIKPSISP